MRLHKCMSILYVIYTLYFTLKNYVTDYSTIYHYPYVHNIKMKDGLNDEVAVQVKTSKDDLFLKNIIWQTHVTFIDCCFGLVSSQFICCLHIFLWSILVIFLSKERVNQNWKILLGSITLESQGEVFFFSSFNIFKTFQYPFEQLC